MSHHPTENSDSENKNRPDDVPETISSIDETDLNFGDEVEFSLVQLSQAYARVLKTNQTAASERKAGVTHPLTSDRPRSIEAAEQAPASSETATEIDDNAACPISPGSIIESILFVGVPPDVKLTPQRIAAVLRDVSPKEVTKIVQQLNARYTAENSAWQIVTADDSLKLILAESLGPVQQEFFGRNKSVKLSQSAIDVLAVVAYNQPLSQHEIEKVRGKSSGGILKLLVRRELIAPVEQFKKSELVQYVTTEKFLNFFRLIELGDLPQSHEVYDFDELE